MTHPFLDKLVVFVGMPQRCLRKDARNALIRVGGIPDERVSTFTNFVVAFSGAENTKAYEKALHNKSLLTILNEEQFLDILEGKALPPEKPKSDVVVIPSVNHEAEMREHEQYISEHRNRKLIDSMARYGIQTPEGHMKIDMRRLEKTARLAQFIKQRGQESE